jgi:hypothetical protein
MQNTNLTYQNGRPLQFKSSSAIEIRDDNSSSPYQVVQIISRHIYKII